MQQGYQFAEFTLDLARGCLRTDNREVVLRPKTFELLRYLVENADRLVTKDEIMKAVWPNVIVTDDSLKRCLSEIRTALDDSAQKIIKTVPRRGIRFVAAVSEPATDKRPPSAAALVATRSGEASTAMHCGELPRLSVVVLPFANLSSDPDQEYFADGLTDNVTTDLSRIPGSFVIARHSAFTYKGRPIDVKQIGSELGVRYVLEGSVQRGNERIRINAQLIEAQTGRQLWAERYDRERADLLAVQDDITGRIARALNVELYEAESRRVLRERASNQDATDLAMRGWAIWHRDMTATNNSMARALFEEALRLDTNSVMALVGLARTHIADLSVWATAAPVAFADWKAARDARIRIADEAISKALALEPRHAFAHVAKGLLLRVRGRQEDSLVEYQRALELNHNEAFAFIGMGVNKFLLGRAEEAIEILLHALRLDPRGNRSPALTTLSRSHLLLGNEDEAIEWIRRAIENNRAYYYPYFWLACALSLKGREKEAREALATFETITPAYDISKNRVEDASEHPVFVRQRERLYAALRRIGVSG